MKKYVFVGKDLDNALEVAKKGLNSKFVEFTVLEEASRGFLGLGKRDCRIVAWLNEDEVPVPLDESMPVGPVSRDIQEYREPSEEPEAPVAAKKAEEEEEDVEPDVIRVPKPKAEKAERVEKEKKDPGPQPKMPPLEPAEVGRFVQTLLDEMHIDCTVEASEVNGCIEVLLAKGDIGAAIGRRGETLNAMQYLTNLAMNKGRRGENYKRINIDSVNYRQRREESLIRLAKSVASKAVSSGREITLEPMEPYERRIIHATLQSDDRVDTKSIGEEPNRKIVVYLK